MCNIRTSRFDRFDWSMFTQNWSFEAATSTRGDVESIEPNTNALGPNQAPHAQIFATEKGHISSHPAIKFLDQTLTIELDAQPKLGPQPTEGLTLEQMLPQYATQTKFVTLLIYDFTPAMNAQKEQAQLIESTNRIFSQLSKFQKVSRFHVKLITDQPESCQSEMVSVLLGLSSENMGLTIVWLFSNHQLDLPV